MKSNRYGVKVFKPLNHAVVTTRYKDIFVWLKDMKIKWLHSGMNQTKATLEMKTGVMKMDIGKICLTLKRYKMLRTSKLIRVVWLDNPPKSNPPTEAIRLRGYRTVLSGHKSQRTTKVENRKH